MKNNQYSNSNNARSSSDNGNDGFAGFGYLPDSEAYVSFVAGDNINYPFGNQPWVPQYDELETITLSPVGQINNAVTESPAQQQQQQFNPNFTVNSGAPLALRGPQWPLEASQLSGGFPNEGYEVAPGNSLISASPPSYHPPPPPAPPHLTELDPSLPGLVGVYSYHPIYGYYLSPPRPPNSEPSLFAQPPDPRQLHNDCHYCNKRLGRKADLIRHIKCIHERPPVEELYQCPVEGCTFRGPNGFVRKDKLKSHYKAVHSTPYAQS
ncbi:hypothetical protein FGG08_002500 [Glutinoglossum americanum]|uniref:C2H2-type domain-containing protein n=1 Tax=Glutinoglossum americanum TaxID=1670608 RepID=A0A9P8I018_9PEZI|nr:hypothetical protein FGG08_002500 [Glutinoglossum americanum]